MDGILHDLGLIEYKKAWDMQNTLADEIAAGTRPPTLLLLEHLHTYTFGRKGQAQNLLWDETELAQRGVAVHWVDRGGDVTYHGPGQLVGYPLISINPKTGVGLGDHVGYVRKLEQALILALARLGLVSGQLTGHTGVWVQPDVFSRCPRCRPEDRKKPAKIAAIGVKVDARGVTRHGFALNLNPNMGYFDGIIPCGIAEYPVVSLADLLSPIPDMERVKQAVVQSFSQVFSLNWVQKPFDI